MSISKIAYNIVDNVNVYVLTSKVAPQVFVYIKDVQEVYRSVEKIVQMYNRTIDIVAVAISHVGLVNNVLQVNVAHKVAMHRERSAAQPVSIHKAIPNIVMDVDKPAKPTKPVRQANAKPKTVGNHSSSVRQDV